MPFDRQTMSPEFFGNLGVGLLTGNTWNEQLANAGLGALKAVDAQREKQERALQLRSTADFLRDKDPQLATMVQNGSMTPADAYKQYLAAQAEKAKQSQPKRSFQKLEDGTYGFADETTGTFKPLGKSDVQKLPAIAEEYNWAKQNGFNGTPQEYQTWKANLSKQKGMTVSYDPVNGFQMTQGDVDKAPPKLTEAQSKDINFLTRAKKAESDLAPIENQLTSWSQKRAEGLPLDLGNYAASPEYQRAQQAGREILAIILRKDTGAAVTQSEFDTYSRIYLPQPGDDAATILAKRQSRETAIEAIQKSLGPLAPQDEGTLPDTQTNSLIAPGQKVETTVNGKKAVIERVPD